jgi:hypothetical protein
MKKILTLCLTFVMALSAQAQIDLSNMQPHTEGFESTFTNGLRVDFLPNWFGNQVQPTAGSPRIHRDTVNRYAGAAALAALPTATVKDTIVASFTKMDASFPAISLWAASDSAKSTGSGTRSAVVYYDFSTDGGATYSAPTQLADSVYFSRVPKPYAQFNLNVPQSVCAGTSLKVRFIVSRGAGTGTAARFLMDDITFTPTTCTAIDRLTANNSLKITPNPNNGQFRLTIEGVTQGNIELFDVMGKQVLSQNNVDLQTAWQPAETLAKGVYWLSVTANGDRLTQKIVVE